LHLVGSEILVYQTVVHKMYNTIASSEPESCQYNIKQDSLSLNMPYMYFAYYSCVAFFIVYIFKTFSQPVQQQDYNTILICQDEEQRGHDLK